MAKVLIGVNQLGTLLSVVIIDVVLAGDNAIVVGMAASGLPVARRRRVICLGIAAAPVLRILFALLAQQLLAIIGMTLAGGVLLLWVSWKMYREFREMRIAERATAAANGNFTAGEEDLNDAGTIPAQISFSGTGASGGSVGGRDAVQRFAIRSVRSKAVQHATMETCPLGRATISRSQRHQRRPRTALAPADERGHRSDRCLSIPAAC